MSKLITNKIGSKKKTFLHNPLFIVFAALFIAAGVFLAFRSFAATGPMTATSGAKDQYGCPNDPQARPTVRLGSRGGCVYRLQQDLNTYFYNLNPVPGSKLRLTVDGAYGNATYSAVVDFKTRINYFNRNDVINTDMWWQITWQIN